MSEKSNNIFYDELLLFLRDEFEKKKNKEGWGDRSDCELREYCDLLNQSTGTTIPMPLEKIIEKYQYLFEYPGPINLEQKILQAFDDDQMQRLKLKPVRIYRGLPRLFRRNQTSFSKIKPNFSHLPSLLKVVAAQSVFSFYSHFEIPKNTKLAMFCYVMADGLGDYYALLEAARVVQKEMSDLEIRIFIISDQKLPPDNEFSIIVWDGSEEQLRYLRSCDLILQIPTYYEKTDEVKKHVEMVLNHDFAKEDLDNALNGVVRAFPKWETIGEYGFIDSSWFHPRSNAFCMGLHFLEIGILIRSQVNKSSICELENKQLLEWLFGSKLDENDISKYRKNHRFFLGYLFNYAGIFVYLHALCKSLEDDTKDIDICIPDKLKFFSYLDERQKAKLDPIEKRYHIRRIVIQVGDGNFAEKKLDNEGKTLRILCPESLSSSDFQRLIAFSENFVAGRGDQSFSDIVSCNKSFFYDPRDHSRFFVKDLIALAENRIREFHSTVSLVRLFAKILEYNLSMDEEEWVDDIAIQKEDPIDLLAISEEMGGYLKDPKTFAGFKKFNRIIATEHSCNDFLVHMVKRSICHHRNPDIVRFEENELNEFICGEKSFSQVVERLQSVLKESPSDPIF